MEPSAVARSKFPRLAAVQERLGHVPLARVVTDPAPGTATIQDLLDESITKGRPCELVDGILVEKPMGFNDDRIGTRIIRLIGTYLDANNIGEVTGAQGMIRFKLDLVRIPDVAFIRWDSVDDTQLIENPTGAFLEVPPDLVVEVLSPSNTVREMEIKLDEYAKAGVKLVWYVDPERREVDVYPKGDAGQMKTFGTSDALDGGDILPGFTMSVGRIFENRAPTRK